MQRYFILFLIVCGYFLVGCGQTGNLYLPSKAQQTQG
jgi:predicted small lipoprotein YifL